MKSVVLGAAALMLSVGAAAADEWEAVTTNGDVAMAVDWASLRITGDMRRINTAVVTRESQPGNFDWATSLLDIDCSRTRYMTLRSSFFFIDGSSASDDFTGDGSWMAIGGGTLVDDVRTAVCAAAPGKQGYFDDPRSFALAGRTVMQQQAGT